MTEKFDQAAALKEIRDFFEKSLGRKVSDAEAEKWAFDQALAVLRGQQVVQVGLDDRGNPFFLPIRR